MLLPGSKTCDPRMPGCGRVGNPALALPHIGDFVFFNSIFIVLLLVFLSRANPVVVHFWMDSADAVAPLLQSAMHVYEDALWLITTVYVSDHLVRYLLFSTDMKEIIRCKAANVKCEMLQIFCSLSFCAPFSYR